MLHLQIVGLKQIIADLFNVTPVAHKNPLGIKLSYFKEPLRFVTEYLLIIR